MFFHREVGPLRRLLLWTTKLLNRVPRGWMRGRRSRFAVVSMQKRLSWYYYFLMLVLFIYITNVNLLSPVPVYEGPAPSGGRPRGSTVLLLLKTLLLSVSFLNKLRLFLGLSPSSFGSSALSSFRGQFQATLGHFPSRSQTVIRSTASEQGI